MKRKWAAAALLLAAGIVAGAMAFYPAGAEESSAAGNEKSAAAMMEEEYDRALEAAVARYEEDPEGAAEALAALDAALIGPPSVTWGESPSAVTAFGKPAAFTLTLYAAQKRGEDQWRLIWSVGCDSREERPGALDCVSLEWDMDAADYYSSQGDGAFSTVQRRGAGVILFNLEDESMGPGDRASGTVRVTAKGGVLRFGARYIHTYTRDTDVSRVRYDLVPAEEGGPGWTAGQTCQPSASRGTELWQQWTANLAEPLP